MNSAEDQKTAEEAKATWCTPEMVELDANKTEAGPGGAIDTILTTGSSAHS